MLLRYLSLKVPFRLKIKCTLGMDPLLHDNLLWKLKESEQRPQDVYQSKGLIYTGLRYDEIAFDLIRHGKYEG